jgi:putative hemolysin
MELTVGVPLLVACVASQSMFSGSEMALVSANRARLEAAADDGSRGAQRALDLLAREDQLLATCLIGTNLSVISGGTIAALIVLGLGLPDWAAVAFFLPFALVLGEALPKTVYRHHADMLAPVLAWPLGSAQILFAPALWVVSGWTGALKAVAGGDERAPRRADLVELLDEKSEGLDPEDRQLIQRLFAMNETVVEDCMTPLVDIAALNETATRAEAAAEMLRCGHSRVPVFRDRVDNVVGVITHERLLFADSNSEALTELLVPTRFVPESKAVVDLLREMRQRAENLVIVVDEYGGSVGLVTVEDLLEEVIGEIQDERDKAEPAVRRLTAVSWRVPARVEVEDLEEATGTPVPDGEYETVAGLILSRIGRIPEPGETVRIGAMTFHIEAASDRAILQVRVEL